MALALFDLDNTLLHGDSDHAWGQFLVDQRIVDRALYEEKNHTFYLQYQRGDLDIDAYLRFALAPLAAHPKEMLHAWRQTFMDSVIEPMLLTKGIATVNDHHNRGDTVVMITATNRFIAEPIAKRLNINHLLATEVEVVDGQYTGRSINVPCFQHGKISHLNTWLQTHGHDLTDSTFYSDSQNDLPLLEAVTTPIVVDADPVLADHARAHGWQAISFRE